MAPNLIKVAKAVGKNIGDAAQAAGKNVKETAGEAGKMMKKAADALARVQKNAAKARNKAKKSLTSEQYRSCKKIIDQAATEAGVAGGLLVQLPTIDNFIIGPRNAKMISSLGKVFGVKYTEADSATDLNQLTTSTLRWAIVERTFAQIFVDWIPVIGNAHNAAAAAAISELLGWKTVLDLCKNRGQEKQGSEVPEVTRDALIQQAEEFLQGSKSYEKDKTAYQRLMNAMDNYDYRHEGDSDPEFEKIYRELTELSR